MVSSEEQTFFIRYCLNHRTWNVLHTQEEIKKNYGYIKCERHHDDKITEERLQRV